MRLVDVFSTRTSCAMLDYLLSHPDKALLQSWLAQALGVDPRAVQRAATRLAARRFVTVDGRFPAGKVIALNGDAEVVRALSAFHECLSRGPRARTRSPPRKQGA